MFEEKCDLTVTGQNCSQRRRYRNVLMLSVVINVHMCGQEWEKRGQLG
jgi:hypothetical protein